MNPFYKNLSLWLVVILMMVMLYNIFNQQQGIETPVAYSDFIAMVENETIQKVTIQDKDLFITDSNGTKFKVFAPNDPELIKTLRKKMS